MYISYDADDVSKTAAMRNRLLLLVIFAFGSAVVSVVMVMTQLFSKSSSLSSASFPDPTAGSYTA